MYTPPIRDDYESILKNILGTSNKIKSSKLLQAYATFSAMLSSGQTLTDSYKQIQSKYPDHPYALLRLPPQQIKSLKRDTLENFTNISLQDFLICVTPDLVCDPFSLMEHFEKCNNEMDYFQLAHHIISLKLNSYQKIAPSKINATTDAFSTVYGHYKETEKHPLPENYFKTFYSAVNIYPLNPSELSPKLISSSRKQMSDLLSILFDELQLTRSQSIKMVRDFFCTYDQAVKINNSQHIYNFVQNKDHATRIKLLNKALKLMARFSPLELLCEISLRKKESTVNEKNKTEALILPNDIPLENGFIFSLFLSDIHHDPHQQILILLPTPHFINKVLRSPLYKNRSITFVFQDSNIAETLCKQADDPSYAPPINKDTRILSLEQCLQSYELHPKKYDKILLFGTRLDLLERDEISSILVNQCAANSALIMLDHSQHIESKHFLPFENDNIVISKIGLIPQGINNSTWPRRKMIVRCIINPINLKSEQSKPIEIHTYTLNTDFKIQALSPMHEDPVLINRNDLGKSSQTLRQQYSLEITHRHATGRERTPSFSHEITPDIFVWCSKTYPKNNLSRPRLEAYVCEPAPTSRIHSGYKERGLRIKSTIKHTTAVPDEEILDWLENVYPYSIVSPKRATQQPAENKLPQKIPTSIQEEIIAHYSEYLHGQNIALKTLWYLYPSLSDQYSKSSFETLSSMMNTIIGEQRVCDLTAETCEYLLTSIYPELSDNSLWARFEMLSTMLDQAVLLGYCTTNNLRMALRQAHIRDKLFAQVRKALTKKHFTQSELQKACAYVLSKIEHGDPLYFGVLFRLMTGLEGKIICALRWSDLLFSQEYNLYSFIIARQMRDDGSFEGFYDNEDYLTFPIPKGLLSLLLKLKQDCGIENDTQLILSSISSPNRDAVVSPKLLNQLTREVILSVGINEKIISLPRHDNQECETDLNKYHGDIIRENFRYWATEAGKLNADELAYLMRNKPISTLGCYYCDFLNEASQLILHAKLNRMEAVIAENPPTVTPKKSTVTASYYTFDTSITPNARRTVLVELCTERNANISIKVSSAFGVSCEITGAVKEDA